jgi:hypothetical protein
MGQDRLKVAVTKSSITLLGNNTKEHRVTPHITLNNGPIPHTDKKKNNRSNIQHINGISFTYHKHHRKCNNRLNTLKAIAGTYFAQDKRINNLIYE